MKRDEATQEALLSLVLILHPARLTKVELFREMVDDPDDFSERDEFERALRDLCRAGLLHRDGEFFAASHAAVCFERLSSHR